MRPPTRTFFLSSVPHVFFPFHLLSFHFPSLPLFPTMSDLTPFSLLIPHVISLIIFYLPCPLVDRDSGYNAREFFLNYWRMYTSFSAFLARKATVIQQASFQFMTVSIKRHVTYDRHVAATKKLLNVQQQHVFIAVGKAPLSSSSPRLPRKLTTGIKKNRAQTFSRSKTESRASCICHPIYIPHAPLARGIFDYN